MSKPIIIIEHLGDEGVKVEGIGFKGRACELPIKQVTDALGTVTSSAKKPEWHQLATTTQATTHQTV